MPKPRPADGVVGVLCGVYPPRHKLVLSVDVDVRPECRRHVSQIVTVDDEAHPPERPAKRDVYYERSGPDRRQSVELYGRRASTLALKSPELGYRQEGKPQSHAAGQESTGWCEVGPGPR